MEVVYFSHDVSFQIFSVAIGCIVLGIGLVEILKVLRIIKLDKDTDRIKKYAKN